MSKGQDTIDAAAVAAEKVAGDTLQAAEKAAEGTAELAHQVLNKIGENTDTLIKIETDGIEAMLELVERIYDDMNSLRTSVAVAVGFIVAFVVIFTAAVVFYVLNVYRGG